MRKYLKPAEAAAYIGSTVQSMTQWRRESIGPIYYKINPKGEKTAETRGRQQILYSTDELDNWVESQTVKINTQRKDNHQQLLAYRAKYRAANQATITATQKAKRLEKRAEKAKSPQ